MVTYLLEILGTYAFAISGIRMASNKEFDLFGAYVVGVATAIGGGTLRDIQLGVTPFWMTSPLYLVCSLAALLSVVFFRRTINRWARAVLLFDTIGLALFTVVGIEKTLSGGFPVWVALVMGCMTGVAGGVMRDVLIGEVPVIFRKELYATPTLTGGAIYGLLYINAPFIPQSYIALAAGATIFLMRYGALRYGWALPKLSNND